MAKRFLTQINGTTGSFTGNLTSSGDISAGGVLKSTQAAGLEGGQIELATSPSGTLSGTNVTVDIYGNKIRFFESGGSNRGAYIDLTSTGAAVGTSLLGGTTGAMNYAQTVGTKQSAISAAGTTIVSVSITTNGYPILVTVSGDVENNSAGGWVVLQLYRGSTAIGNPVHAEGSAGSENSPYSISTIDAPTAGTYTYALKLNNSAGGTFNFGESAGPVITAVELSGPKGDTGATGVSGSAFGNISASGTASINNLTVYGTPNFVNGSIPLYDLSASTVTIGTTAIGLGNTSTSLAGLSSLSASGFSAAGTASFTSASMIINNTPLVIKSDSISLGSSAGVALYTGDTGAQIAIGYTALKSAGLSSGNIGIGYQALTSAIGSGNGWNTALGYNAGSGQVSGASNVYIGSYVGASAPGNGNVFISDGGGNLKISADSTGQVSIPGTLSVTGNINGGQVLRDTLYITTTGAGTFSKSSYPNLKGLRVKMVGGGGGAGAASATVSGSFANGGAGGGAGYVEVWVPASALGATTSYTVGAGGAGGAYPSTTPASGGTTSFGTIAWAYGGNPGANDTQNALPGIGNSPGAPVGGSITAGYQGITITGAYGGRGWASGLYILTTVLGGTSYLGTQSPTYPYTSGNGNNANNYGTGGQGGKNIGAQATNRTGGNGSDGVIILEVYS